MVHLDIKYITVAVTVGNATIPLTVCPLCGAYVANEEQHTAFHEEQATPMVTSRPVFPPTD